MAHNHGHAASINEPIWEMRAETKRAAPKEPPYGRFDDYGITPEDRPGTGLQWQIILDWRRRGRLGQDHRERQGYAAQRQATEPLAVSFLGAIQP